MAPEVDAKASLLPSGSLDLVPLAPRYLFHRNAGRETAQQLADADCGSCQALRISLDAYHATQAHGGIARYIRALLPALAAASASDSFVLFTNQFRQLSPSWDPGHPNVRLYDLRIPRRLMQACWDYLAWPPVETFIGSLDIFHGTHFVLPAVRRAKCVLTVHDLTYLRHPEYFGNRELNERGYRKELPRALARVDAVIAVSRHTRDDLAELLNYPEGRIRVIHLGVEPHFFVSRDAERLAAVKSRYRLDGPYLVFSVGTPEPRKNLLRTVAAARRASARMPLVLIGQQDAIRATLENDVRGVVLTGPVPDADLPWVLHGAELALYPSLYEGFGLPAVEAMAAGVPLITSNRSALPEVVEKAAVLVDPESEDDMEEAIRELLEDGDRRQQLIELGRARARELSWNVTAQRVLEVYRELV